MPVVNPSFQSDSRLETSSGSSYYPLVANFHFGLLALVAVVGARFIFKIIYTRRRENPITGHLRHRYYYFHSSSAKAVPREFTRAATEEKSRGVSILNDGRMSASQRGPISFSSQGLGDEVASGTGKDTEEVVDVPAAAEASEGPVMGNMLPSLPVGQRLPVLPLLSRPPPPPPLTLPGTSPTATFTFEGRRRSFPPPELPSLDTEAFIHQPNPDYAGDSSSVSVARAAAPSAEAPDSATAATAPRRRSYMKTVSLPVPGSGVETSEKDEFRPSSFPPTSPRLPPPAEFPETTTTTSHGQPHDFDVHGEIISSFDDAGHGWKRHTRVYGGGVCLACLQSGGEGGFYGENVRPEDRR